MKVVTPKQMSHLEALAFKDGFSQNSFMEDAGSGVALAIHDYVERNSIGKQAILLCGKGNNAGDAYVAGFHLIYFNYDVTALQTVPIDQCSPLCIENQKRFVEAGGVFIEISSSDEIDLSEGGIIVDGLFGTGFKGNVEQPFSAIIKKVNESGLPIISIDIPSGLNGETGEVNGEAIIATETAYLGLPKIGFFLNQGWNHVGKLTYVDFGLPESYETEAKATLEILSTEQMQSMLPEMKRIRHKYQAGYVVGLAGSPDMPGAAMLSSYAALSGGAGIVRLLHPEGMQTEVGFAPYELLRSTYNENSAEELVENLNKASAAYIGPGLGKSPLIKNLLRQILPKLTKPCVIDADALNFIAEESLEFPKNAIITPHHGEMCRLLKRKSLDTIELDFLHTCQEFAEKHQVTLVLKGAPTFIFQTGEAIQVNLRGDPGMATAGSGDVLTGLIAALLAQGLTPHRAALLGVYLHSVAGEFAAQELTSYCMIASDITNHFPDAFRFRTL